MNPWDTAELAIRRHTFSDVCALFPLPNLVLYPHVMQPLHIFEERYREMLEDALAGDELIAMAAARTGLGNRLRQPPARRSATPAWARSWPIIGSTMARYNVLLLGVQRVRIVHELDPLRSFRQAQVEIVEDCYDFDTPADREVLQDKLVTPSANTCPAHAKLPEQLEDCSHGTCRSACSPTWRPTHCRSISR